MSNRNLVYSAAIVLAAVSLFAAEAPFRPGSKGKAGPPLAIPGGVKAHRDIPYVENGHPRQKLDLYVPEKGGAPLPLIVWIHGGGWSGGSKDGCPPLRAGYTGRGYAVASIGYRLSGDAIFPAQIEDCKAAIRWLRAHAKEYGLDPNRFGVWGSSAGGHLAALLAEFFDRCLKGNAAPEPTATKTESAASAMATPGGTEESRGPRMTWEQVRTRGGVAADGRVTRDRFKGPTRLFDLLDRNGDGALTREDFEEAPAAKTGRAPRDPEGGIFFYAKEGYETNTAAIANPDVLGGWVQFYWSDKNFDPEFAAALSHGARTLGRSGAAAASVDAPKDSPPVQTGKGFQLSGDRWTYRDGEFSMDGILLRPEGKGPHPAVLISHGLGGSAESFGMQKAREFVKWGLICIAPNYTHAGSARGAPRGPDFGASEENLRRAGTCIELLRTMPGVDPQRIGAYGHSMGGFVTIGLAAAAPDSLQAAAITGSGVAPRAGYPAPPGEDAARIRTPFLILHGGSDPVVRPEQSASLKEVLDRNRIPNERRVFDGEGHAIDQSKRDEVFGAIRDWFRRHGLLRP